MKKTKRKGFNFLRSYYDVYNKLKNDKDKLQFIELILAKQFHDIDPKGELSFAVDLAYESQRHQIEQSVKGYKSKTKDEMQGPCQGGVQGGDLDPRQQEELKNKSKSKDKKNELIPSFLEFKEYALEKCLKLNYDLDLKKLNLKYESWVENNWQTGGKNSRKIKNWKSTLLNTLPYLQKDKLNGQKQPRTMAEKMRQQYGIE